jgi:protein-S-isoprenylcysteine O-methyltransferase Ste14
LRPLPFSGGSLYAIIFWSVYISWFVLETVTSIRKRSTDRSTGRDRNSYLLLMILLWLAIGSAFALAVQLLQATILGHRSEVFFTGIALMLAGVVFRFYAMSVLGKYFTYQVAIQSGQTVIDTGPYRYLRHPSYSGALVTLLGLGLALGNWASLLALFACMGAAYSYRISVEEHALLLTLGEPYKEYMRRTWRLVPFLL